MKVRELREWIAEWPADADINIKTSIDDLESHEFVGMSWPSGDYRTNDIHEVSFLINKAIA